MPAQATNNTLKPLNLTPDHSILLRKMANMICSAMTLSDEKFVVRSKKIARGFAKKIDGTKNANDAQIISFLNKYKSHLLCPKVWGDGEEHYMRFADNSNATFKFFTKFLGRMKLKAGNISPDLNVVVGISSEGNPQTFLDTLDEKSKDMTASKSYRDSYRNMMSSYRNMFGAKLYHELSNEKQDYLLLEWKAADVKQKP